MAGLRPALPDMLDQLDDTAVESVCRDLVNSGQMATVAWLAQTKRRFRDICQPMLSKAKTAAMQQCRLLIIPLSGRQGPASVAVICGKHAGVIPRLNEERVLALAKLVPDVGVRGVGAAVFGNSPTEDRDSAPPSLLWLSQLVAGWNNDPASVHPVSLEFVDRSW